MKFSFNIKLGDTTILIEDEAPSVPEMWAKIAFFHSLPVEGPGGEKDLLLSYRKPQGYEYYAIVCPSAGMEFKMGQMKKDKAQLFPKRWEKLPHGVTLGYGGDEEEEDDRAVSQQAATKPASQQDPLPMTLDQQTVLTEVLTDLSKLGVKPQQIAERIKEITEGAVDEHKKLNREQAAKVIKAFQAKLEELKNRPRRVA